MGDVLRRVDPRSKVIAISGKDRGAILPAGKAGTALHVHGADRRVRFQHALHEGPSRWVKAFPARGPRTAYFGREWKPLLRDSAYAVSLPDEQKWYAKGGKLPKRMGEGMDKPGPSFTAALTTPSGTRWPLLRARRDRGREPSATTRARILAVSLSGHDYITMHTARIAPLARSRAAARPASAVVLPRPGRSLGKDSYLVVLTSDHGFMPSPDHSHAPRAERRSARAAARPSRGLNAELGKQIRRGPVG